MKEPLIVLEGIFHDSGEGIAVYPDSGDPVPLREVFEPRLGGAVNLSLHHFPPNPPQKDVPGGGSCLWGALCPCGHVEDPAWLYNLSSRGVLQSPESGIWELSGERLPLAQYMLGHRGRLVLFTEESGCSEKSVGDLLDETESLLGILEQLRGVVKGE